MGQDMFQMACSALLLGKLTASTADGGGTCSMLGTTHTQCLEQHMSNPDMQDGSLQGSAATKQCCLQKCQ